MPMPADLILPVGCCADRTSRSHVPPAGAPARCSAPYAPLVTPALRAGCP